MLAIKVGDDELGVHVLKGGPQDSWSIRTRRPDVGRGADVAFDPGFGMCNNHVRVGRATLNVLSGGCVGNRCVSQKGKGEGRSDREGVF